eukprot:TRINITY_DN2570_c0_g2_i1.p2 TRINITY_DN2570_c0_g2~~TRINITY_DN2570_c0_g2_i1.p2  ORF type:complete len:411 (-),score=42.80 TRINITY_DN2570_c0_g2_i1:664-1896(-)
MNFLSQVLAITILVLFAIFAILMISGLDKETDIQIRQLMGSYQPSSDIVVIYHSNDFMLDPENAVNLNFFLQNAVDEDDGIHYIFVMRRDDSLLPELPKNARYAFNDKECNVFGALGWLIRSGELDIKNYRYFVMISSKVKGPYLPPYLQGKVRWVDLLVAKLKGNVKLVGPVIDCTPLVNEMDSSQVDKRMNPYIQSSVLATDYVGLKLWMDDEHILKCYEDAQLGIWYGDSGASLKILKNNYNLESLLTRYGKVDWRDETNWGCNDNDTPERQFGYDGISIHPFETLFVRTSDNLLDLKWQAARTAYKYDMWTGAQKQDGQAEVMSNEYVDNPWYFRVLDIWATKYVGMHCFKMQDYLDRNLDLPRNWSAEKLFEHLMNFGQFEGRPFQQICDGNLSSVLENKSLLFS